jgi:hypothetical protein
MRIALYSRKARRAVHEARMLAQQQHHSQAAQEMRAFRKALFESKHAILLKELTKFADFFSLSEFCDLVFHVQEHVYDLPEIESMLEKLSLKLHKFYIHSEDQQRYKAMFPGASMNDIKKWDMYEQAFPGTFAIMYRFWCSAAQNPL